MLLFCQTINIPDTHGEWCVFDTCGYRAIAEVDINLNTFNLEIEEKYAKLGFTKQCVELIEEYLRREGYRTAKWNDVPFALGVELGYTVTSLTGVKSLV